MFIVLSSHFHLRKPAFDSHQEKRVGIATAYEVVKKERFPDDDAGTVEAVAKLQLTVRALDFTDHVVVVPRGLLAQRIYRLV